MKSIEITTQKAEFLLVDGDSIDTKTLEKFAEKYGLCISLSGITEERASELVDDEDGLFYDYVTNIEDNEGSVYCNSAIDSLRSLIETKGVHLYENPQTKILDDNYSKNNRIMWEKAYKKTFYNPIIFVERKLV